MTSDNVAAISDDGLGVEIRFDKNGQLLSVRSTYYHPVEMPDRRGISKAYTIAEEKAKANIARYRDQVVSTSRAVSEIDESLNKSARSRGNAGETWTKDNSRTVVESLNEITTSGASAVLKGVRILERSYDETKEEVKVVVGINRDSLAGAEQLRSGLNAPPSTQGNSKGSSGQSLSDAPPTGFPRSGSESTKSPDADKF